MAKKKTPTKATKSSKTTKATQRSKTARASGTTKASARRATKTKGRSMQDAASSPGERGMRHQGLGRGLGLLIRDRTEPAAPAPATAPTVARKLGTTSPDTLKPNPDQPRKHFDEAEMEGLVQTVRENGVLQPILVRRTEDGYEIIAGERRWRAAMKAGLTEVPIHVSDVDASGTFELSLIENLQRQDLDPIEEALGYTRLAEDSGYTHEEIATRVGKDRATVSNALRLLKLPAAVQAQISAGELSPGHGRALLGLPNELDRKPMADQAIAEQLSVRELERRVQQMRGARDKAAGGRPSGLTPELRDVQQRLQQTLNSRVRIQPKGKGGKIELHYGSLEEFERIRMRLMGY